MEPPSPSLVHTISLGQGLGLPGTPVARSYPSPKAPSAWKDLMPTSAELILRRGSPGLRCPSLDHTGQRLYYDFKIETFNYANYSEVLK